MTNSVVVAAQLIVLRVMVGHRRTSGLIVASGVWAATYALMLLGVWWVAGRSAR